MQPHLKFSLTIFCGLMALPPITARAAALEFKVAPNIPPVIDATPPPPTNVAKPVALHFIPSSHPVSLSLNQTAAPTFPLDLLFTGASASLVAKAVGSAEGTRTPVGGYTAAYYGHVDPGNGVWNLGSFSYQHGANSPEQADRRQLKRLQQQALELRRQAQSQSFTLSLLEELNAIDLANQAPLAALDRGYIPWLYAARQQQGIGTAEQIVWARTKAFLDPDTGSWDAPGLGNHWDAIYRDQLRRYDAIERALGDHRP